MVYQGKKIKNKKINFDNNRHLEGGWWLIDA